MSGTILLTSMIRKEMGRMDERSLGISCIFAIMPCWHLKSAHFVSRYVPKRKVSCFLFCIAILALQTPWSFGNYVIRMGNFTDEQNQAY